MKLKNDLNKFLSNLAVMTFKLHNLHWNVGGSNFVQIHEYTEKLYDDAFEKFDEVAEILKMKGEMPLVKLSDYLKTATLKEIDASSFTVSQVLGILQEDISLMVKDAEKIRKEAAEADDYQVSTVFEDYLKGYAKTLWFLRAMKQ